MLQLQVHPPLFANRKSFTDLFRIQTLLYYYLLLPRPATVPTPMPSAPDPVRGPEIRRPNHRGYPSHPQTHINADAGSERSTTERHRRIDTGGNMKKKGISTSTHFAYSDCRCKAQACRLAISSSLITKARMEIIWQKDESKRSSGP